MCSQQFKQASVNCLKKVLTLWIPYVVYKFEFTKKNITYTSNFA